MLPVNWQSLPTQDRTGPPVVDSRRRLRWCLAGFVGLLLVVFGRQVQLEVTQGKAFRQFAARPLERRHDVLGVRGPHPGRWRRGAGLRQGLVGCRRSLSLSPATARRPLASRSGRNGGSRGLREKCRAAGPKSSVACWPSGASWRVRLAQLAGVSLDAWNARAGRIQARVERVAETVNRRRRAEWQRRNAGESGHYEPITVREELDYHVVAEGLSDEAGRPKSSRIPTVIPGTKVVELHRRVYPHGPLSAHVLGYLGADDAGDGGPGVLVGKAGVERQYEDLLRGRRGTSRRIDRPRRKRDPFVCRRETDDRKRPCTHARSFFAADRPAPAWRSHPAGR